MFVLFSSLSLSPCCSFPRPTRSEYFSMFLKMSLWLPSDGFVESRLRKSLKNSNNIKIHLERLETGTKCDDQTAENEDLPDTDLD